MLANLKSEQASLALGCLQTRQLTLLMATLSLLRSLKELHMCTKIAEEVQCGFKEEVLSGLREKCSQACIESTFRHFTKSGRPAEHF